MYLKFVLLIFTFIVVKSINSHEFEGDDDAKRSEPLTRRQMVRCIDENVKYLGPKSFEVEKHKRKEETKMSIVRQKRGARCTVETIVTDDEPSEIHGESENNYHHPHRHRHHHHHHHHHHDQKPKNFKTKTSYSISKSVTSPPVEHNFNTRHSSSSDSEISSHEMAHDSFSSPENLPTIPHLPDIPHIGHEGTYPSQGEDEGLDIPQRGNRNPDDSSFAGEEPGPGEKTITFKTNTHRHEIVDQTGFVKEKSNGYPIRPNDDWRARFKDMPNLLDEDGRIISSAGYSVFRCRYFSNGIFIVVIILSFIRNTIFGFQF